MNRQQFMDFFRSEENDLTIEDRIEVFRYIMLGSSDFTIELLNEIFEDYGVQLEAITKH